MVEKYTHIYPAALYRSLLAEAPTEADLWCGKIPNSYGNYPSGNDFIDLFAGLIRKYGYRPIVFYAKVMGVNPRHFTGAIIAITGMEARQWLHRYLNLAVCELIEKTDWSLTRIARRLNFSSVSFSRFFKLMNKCQPHEYMTLKRYGKKWTYHYNE